MSESREQLLCEKGAEFFGAITASLSHEMNNVLAIIGELSGLVDDFLGAAAQGGRLDVEKLQGTTQRISAQVARGQDYVRRLNRFSHTVDARCAAIEVNEAVEAIAALCRRFGTLRKVQLETRLPEASVAIEGSAFDFQHVVFRCIDLALGASTQGDVVSVAVHVANGGVQLTVTGGSAVDAVPDRAAGQAALGAVVEKVQGAMDATIQAGQPVRVSVWLPRVLGGASGDAGPD
jgi:C4-dicarboxylate-specific signal transduction histidine kinase